MRFNSTGSDNGDFGYQEPAWRKRFRTEIEEIECEFRPRDLKIEVGLSNFSKTQFVRAWFAVLLLFANDDGSVDDARSDGAMWCELQRLLEIFEENAFPFPESDELSQEDYSLPGVKGLARCLSMRIRRQPEIFIPFGGPFPYSVLANASDALVRCLHGRGGVTMEEAAQFLYYDGWPMHVAPELVRDDLGLSPLAERLLRKADPAARRDLFNRATHDPSVIWPGTHIELHGWLDTLVRELGDGVDWIARLGLLSPEYAVAAAEAWLHHFARRAALIRRVAQASSGISSSKRIGRLTESELEAIRVVYLVRVKGMERAQAAYLAAGRTKTGTSIESFEVMSRRLERLIWNPKQNSWKDQIVEKTISSSILSLASAVRNFAPASVIACVPVER